MGDRCRQPSKQSLLASDPLSLDEKVTEELASLLTKLNVGQRGRQIQLIGYTSKPFSRPEAKVRVRAWANAGLTCMASTHLRRATGQCAGGGGA